jgi:hypothetical protein
MQGLAAAAGALGFALASAPSPGPVKALILSADLRYEVHGVFEGAGLGGQGACAPPGQELVLLAYRVTNAGAEDLPAPAVPRLLLVGPTGLAYHPDPSLSAQTEARAMPFLSFQGGRLRAGQAAVQADVYITPAGAVRSGGWRARADRLAAMAEPLPSAERLIVEGCGRSAGPPPLSSEPEADAPARRAAPTPTPAPPTSAAAPD